MMEVIYLYNGASRLTIPVTDSAERSHSLQQHNYVKLVWKSAENTPISANAYIEYEGQVFYALDDYFPTHKDGIYEYDIEFHSIEDTFNRPLFFRYVDVLDQTTGETTSWKEIEWSLNGNLKTIADIVITCLNKAYDNAYFELPKDSYTDTLLMSYSFSGNSIADALSTIAEQNETEWWLETTTEYVDDKRKYILHFDKCEIGTTIELNDHYTEDANGVWQSGGLKSVSQSGNTNIIPQKLYVYGSERNIIKKTVEQQIEGAKMNVSYDKKLRLPKEYTGRLDGVSGQFHQERYDDNSDWLTIYQNDALDLKIFLNHDSSISIDGINNHFEQVKIFDEVYPKMDMEVTAVSVQNPNSENPIYWLKADRLKSITTENPVDGSINPGKLGLLIEGCTLMCTFTSGLLNGREFECAWRESSAEIGLIPIDENDVQIPSGVFKPQEGDTFILWNLAMPQSSIDIAQRELLKEAINYIEELATSITETDCVSEPEAFRLAGHDKQIQVGQRITVTSDVFRNGKLASRIIKFSYKLTKPYDISFTLASSRQTGRLATLENMIADVTHEVHAVNQVQQAISRRQWHDTEEMMSMLDSIQKQMVVVGDENNAFGTTCSLKYNSDTKQLLVSEGYVLHQSFTDNDFNGQWNIDSFTRDMSAIDPDGKTPFYVFFVCPKSKETAEKGYTDVASALPIYNDYYVFILGILSSEFEGKRAFNQTNGITSIAGGNVTTNVIQDPGQRLIVDFANATITARNGATIKGAIQFEKGEGENDLGTVLENMGKDVQYAKDNTQATNLFSKKQIDQYASEEGVDSYIKNYNLSTGVIECIDNPMPYLGRFYDIFGRYGNYKQGVQYSMKMNVDFYLIGGYLEFSVYCDTVNGEQHELFFHYAENQGEQQHIEIECTTPEGEDIKSIYFEILYDDIYESNFVITQPQLVEGNVIPTTWQPNMEDVTTDVQEAHEAAKDAELEADKAKERMDNWVADNIFSKLEQQGLEDELRKINADYSEISTECSKYDIEMGDYVTTYDIIVPQLQDIISELNANETTAIPSDFEKNLDEYYTQRTAILTTISNKADEVAQKYADNAATNAVDGLVLATENILKDSMLFSTSSNPILRQLTIPIKANTEYVFSIENTMTDGGYTNVLLLDQTLSYELANLRCEPNKKSSVVFTCIEEQREVYLYAEPIQATLFGVKIAEGNRYSPWEGTAEEQQALITLTNAMKGSTDIIGGLVLTNLIQLKDEGGNVVAGITGLTTEDNAGEGDVFAWAGGPLEKAISGTTPVLLKRHGKGSKIGCLVVEDNDKVRVKTNNGSVLIDADGGITMYDDNEIEKIVIFPENLTIDDINEYHTINILTNDITESNISMPRPIDYYKVISSFIVSASNNLLKINPNKKTWEVEFNFSANSEMNNSSYPGAYSIDTYLELYNETTGEITNIETAKFNGSYSSTTTIGNKITLTNNEEIKLTNIPTGTYIFRFVFKCKDIAYIPPGAILPSGTPYIYNAKMAISFKKSDGNYLKAEYSKQNNVTYIGKNGLLVNNNYWAYMFASINGEILDFRLRGLPSSPINTGQLYVTEDGILKVKQ